MLFAENFQNWPAIELGHIENNLCPKMANRFALMGFISVYNNHETLHSSEPIDSASREYIYFIYRYFIS